MLCVSGIALETFHRLCVSFSGFDRKDGKKAGQCESSVVDAAWKHMKDSELARFRC
jgi:hypothetical protein